MHPTSDRPAEDFVVDLLTSSVGLVRENSTTSDGSNTWKLYLSSPSFHHFRSLLI
jgi:hypothetical protein